MKAVTLTRLKQLVPQGVPVVLCGFLLTTLTLGLTGCRYSNSTNTSESVIQEKLERIIHRAPSGSRQAAIDLYHEAWEMIDTEFYDHQFNGQKWIRWKNHYDPLIQDEEDAYVAIQTMLASLNDDYTRFLPPREMKEQSMSIDSKLYGVGIQIFVKSQKLVVASPLEGTPAAKAGIQPKDEIMFIDGKTTAGMSVEDAADLIRGPEDTPVRLTIKRGDKTFSVTLNREEIKIKSVFTKEIKDKRIGYVRLSSFISETAFQEMKEAIRNMASKGALIVDLRGNYGGLLTNAVDISDMFLDEGGIVSIVDQEKEVEAFDAKPGQAFRKPMVVLIDGGSASASEIMSGALKDNHRATLIGTKTFGKGLVQKINMLSNESGMNITISKYLTPNGTDINKKGIQPDILVPYTEKDFYKDQDPQLDKAIQFLQSHSKL
jgi:carboxyl-terminal processing protease